MSEIIMNYYCMGNVSPEHLVEFRFTLEPTLAMLAAERITDSEMDGLKKIIDAIKAGLDEARTAEDRRSCRAKALEFHALVADACHNPLFSHLMRAMTDVFEKVLNQVPLLDPEIGRYDLEHCRQVYEAFERRDRARAYNLMAKHFDKLKQYIAGIDRVAPTEYE